jgi:hypothetical protein
VIDYKTSNIGADLDPDLDYKIHSNRGKDIRFIPPTTTTMVMMKFKKE